MICLLKNWKTFKHITTYKRLFPVNVLMSLISHISKHSFFIIECLCIAIDGEYKTIQVSFKLMLTYVTNVVK
jgi:hypothetical protein